MLITPENVGDIIQLNHNGSLIRIEEVADGYVHYSQENGAQYGTFHHEIEGSVVRDPNRIQEFRNNFKLGSSLLSAESCAIRNLMNISATKEQKIDADLVLQSVRNMKQRLSDRLSLCETQTAFKQPQHRSLDSIISRASADAMAQQQSKQPVSIGFER